MRHELQLPWGVPRPCPPPPFFSYFLSYWCCSCLFFLFVFMAARLATSIWLHTICHICHYVCVCVCVGSWESHLDLNCIAHLTVISFLTVATCVLHWNSNNVYIELLMNKMYANQSVLQLTIMFIDFQLVFILIDKTYSYLVFVYFSFSALTNCSSFVCLLFLLLEIKV